MVYLNLIGRSSSRLISARACRQRPQSLLLSSTTTPASSSVLPVGSSPWNCTDGSHQTTNTINAMAVRSKHSSTQIKRLFKQNPAKRRIALRDKRANAAAGVVDDNDEGIIPEATLSPIVPEPTIFRNGWNPPSENRPEYPFLVSRTKNKPNDAVGFLPVYSEFRKDGARVTTRIKKVSGDRELFLNELRAALQIPVPKNPREDNIRIRTGGTIEVKGNRVMEVKTWLAGLGF